MVNATRDQNRVPALIGLSSVDGVSLVRIAVNPVNGKVKMEFGSSVSAVVAQNAARDQNHITTIAGVSSSDNTIFIPLSVNPATGAILAKST